MKNSNSNNNGMNNNTRTLLTLLTGAVAGAVTALLLAPQSGSETRDALRRTTSRLGDDLGSTLKQGLDKINSLRGGAEEDEFETSDTMTEGLGSSDSYGSMSGSATGRRQNSLRGAGNPTGLDSTSGTTTSGRNNGGIGNV